MSALLAACNSCQQGRLLSGLRASHHAGLVSGSAGAAILVKWKLS